jgi:hypothetical protein
VMRHEQRDRWFNDELRKLATYFLSYERSRLNDLSPTGSSPLKPARAPTRAGFCPPAYLR